MQNTKECSMTYRQSETYSHKMPFSTLKHEAISIRVFTEKHPYAIKGQLFEEFNRKSGSVLNRKRWKANFFLKGEKNQENTNHFGLSSNKTPPTILELKPFEEDVLKLLENIKFRDTKNHFQENLANDLFKLIHPIKFSFLQTKPETYMKPRSTHITSSCMTSQKHINTDLRTTFRKSTMN